MNDRIDLKSCFPLSESQLNIWDLEQAYPGASMNNICETVRIRGRFDIALLEKALDLAVKLDPSLRIQITRLPDGTPLQFESPYVPSHFPVYDFSGTDEAGISRFEESLAREAMCLFESPLYCFAILRIGEQEGGFYLKTHHLISDGYSAVQLINRITQSYLAFLDGEKPDEEELPGYRAHVEEEKAYLSSASYKADKQYWGQMMRNIGQPVSIRDFASAEISPVGDRVVFTLSETMSHRLDDFCRVHRIAPFAVFYTAILIYLGRVRSSVRVCIGSPVHNRRNVTDRKTSGMFVNTLPFCSEFDEKKTFEETIGSLADEWLELLRHQRFPFEDIVKEARAADPSVTRLFHIVLSYQDSWIYRSQDTMISFSGQWHYAGSQAEHVCIHLVGREDGSYQVSYDYLTQLFPRAQIEDLHRYLVNIMMRAVENPAVPVSEITFMEHDELEKVIYTFNKTSAYCPEGNLADRLERNFRSYPDRAAIIQNGSRYTYRTLADCSERTARSILALTHGTKAIIAIFLPKTFSLISAIAAVIRSGCAWVILPASLPDKRIRTILSDCGAAALISTKELASCHDTGDIPLVDADGTAADETVPVCHAEPGDPAYLVYTSGSTGTPKGVVISQRSLLNFTEAMHGICEGAVLSLCNTGFDAFLLESIVPLLNGQTVILATEAEQEDPSASAALIRGYDARSLAMTPSRLAEFLKNEDFSRESSRLKVIVCGGENFPAGLLRKLRTICGARIYNQYGPSETTIGVSLGLLNDKQQLTAGKPMPNCRLYVLDRERKPLPTGACGELYIGGIAVGIGYHNREELTSYAFLDNPYERGERMYRTGDLASWTENGEIVVKGRADRQVKLRGQRVELDEINSCILSYPAVRSAAVTILKTEEHPLLAAYYCAGEPMTQQELREFLASCLPDYMIPSWFCEVDEIPLTKNGKADCGKLPLPETRQEQNGTGTETTDITTLTVLDVFRRVLGNPGMTSSDDYFLCGGDSLNGMRTLAELERIFGRRLRISALYACRNAAQLSRLLAGGTDIAAAGAYCPIRKITADSYPLTSPQMGIYFETMRNPSGTEYNMPCGFRVKGRIDPEQLQKALDRLSENESVLRTFFVSEGGTVCQKTADSVSVGLEILQGDSPEEAGSAFVRPFDPGKAPLFRAALYHGTDGDALFADLHHIIGDAVTAGHLIQELRTLYGGGAVSAPSLSFTDYAGWITQEGTERMANADSWWKEEMKDFSPSAALPLDAEQPDSGAHKGDVVLLRFSPQMSEEVKDRCGKKGITPFMFFSGVYGIFLSKLTGEETVSFGTPVSVRCFGELADTAGLFVNTLPLRISAGKGTDVDTYLSSVRDAVVDLLDHADADAPRLKGYAGIKSGSGEELYRTIFSMRPVDVEGFTFGEYETEAISGIRHDAKAELSLETALSGGTFEIRLEYDAERFHRDTAELFARCIRTIASSLLGGDGKTIGSLESVSAEDRYRLIERPEAVRLPFSEMTIDEQIDGDALSRPDAPAVMFHDCVTTAGELRRSSDRLSALIREAGAGRGDNVGVLVRRGPELLCAMIAVLKAGGAYVPMLPGFPESRLRYMMETANISLVLCDPETKRKIEEAGTVYPCRFLEIPSVGPVNEDAETTEKSGAEEAALRHFKRTEGLCCVLFTSGSTGVPKGVMIRHRAFSNLTSVLYPLLSSVDGPMLCSTNSVFDVFATETLIALACGRCVVMADEEEMMLPWKTSQLIVKHHVTTVQYTPTRVRFLMENKEFADAVHDMPLFLVCGEKFHVSLLKTLRDDGCRRICNLYGPTEATVYAAIEEAAESDRVVIGRVLPNCRGYVLDRDMDRVMASSCGELYLAGECLAAGYIGNEELTASSFVPDPFYPGELMYRTGDIVRLLPDGRYDYIGRKDRQVKLNGQRVEPDEITARILESKLVSEAAVTVRDNGTFMTLEAFVCPEEGGCADVPALRKYLERVLPSYMVPSEITVIRNMPLTPSGKVDYQRLMKEGGAEAEDSAEETEKPAMQKAAEKPEDRQDIRGRLVRIWKEVLHTDTIEEDRSFFEQGGTSFGALSVLGRYYADGMQMTLSDFYGRPTIAEQAALFGGSREKEAIFLTGGTGFLGAHLLKSLLEKGYTTVYCLVRGEVPDRLFEVLGHYFGRAFAERERSHIIAVNGDIRNEDLGIRMPDEETERNMTDSVRYVIHAAADVRHYVPGGESEIVNRDGTAHVISFAKKCGARMIDLSTVSICGEFIRQDPFCCRDFSEDDFDIGQNWQDNTYVRSKFEAEKRIQEAAEKEGLDAVVMRVGRLVGRSSDGVFQINPKNNAFWQFINGLAAFRSAPEELLSAEIEVTAVDECAEAVVSLLSTGMDVCHIFNPHLITMREAAAACGIRPALCSREEFERALYAKSIGSADPLMTMFFVQYQRMLTVVPRIRPVCDKTAAELERNGFLWKKPDPNVLLSSFRGEKVTEK